jgi:hypothetical protein
MRTKAATMRQDGLSNETQEDIQVSGPSQLKTAIKPLIELMLKALEREDASRALPGKPLWRS